MTTPQLDLSRRERQIMDVLFRLGEGNAHEVHRLLPDDPGYDSVRVTLRNLEKKGIVRHRTVEQRNVYRPTLSHEEASEGALAHLLRTFFRGSPDKAILALLDLDSTKLTSDQLDELSERIKKARGEE